MIPICNVVFQTVVITSVYKGLFLELVYKKQPSVSTSDLIFLTSHPN